MERLALKLFSTPIHYYSKVLAPRQLEEIFEYCFEVDAGRHGAFVGDVKSSVNAGQEPRLFAGEAADLIQGCPG
jgi:hypothetical protein